MGRAISLRVGVRLVDRFTLRLYLAPLLLSHSGSSAGGRAVSVERKPANSNKTNEDLKCRKNSRKSAVGRRVPRKSAETRGNRAHRKSHTCSRSTRLAARCRTTLNDRGVHNGGLQKLQVSASASSLRQTLLRVKARRGSRCWLVPVVVEALRRLPLLVARRRAVEPSVST